MIHHRDTEGTEKNDSISLERRKDGGARPVGGILQRRADGCEARTSVGSGPKYVRQSCLTPVGIGRDRPCQAEKPDLPGPDRSGPAVAGSKARPTDGSAPHPLSPCEATSRPSHAPPIRSTRDLLSSGQGAPISTSTVNRGSGPMRQSWACRAVRKKGAEVADLGDRRRGPRHGSGSSNAEPLSMRITTGDGPDHPTLLPSARSASTALRNPIQSDGQSPRPRRKGTGTRPADDRRPGGSGASPFLPPPSLMPLQGALMPLGDTIGPSGPA